MNAQSTDESTATVETVPDDVSRAIRDRAEAIKRRELETAFERLEARGDLSSEERRAVAHLATAVVDRLLAAPESALEDASASDEETVRTAIDLFDPNR